METMSEWAGDRNEVGKVRVHLELNLMGDMNGNETDFYRHSCSKRKTKLDQLLVRKAPCDKGHGKSQRPRLELY